MTDALCVCGHDRDCHLVRPDQRRCLARECDCTGWHPEDCCYAAHQEARMRRLGA